MAGGQCYQWCCENTRVCRKGKEFLNVGGEGVNSVSSTHLSRSGKNLSRS